MTHIPNIEGDTYFRSCPNCGMRMKIMTWEQAVVGDMGCRYCGCSLKKFTKRYYDELPGWKKKEVTE